MGVSSSIALRPEEVAELTVLTGFSRRRIANLYNRFKKLDTDRDGVIGEDDLLKIPEFAMNPLARRMTALIDREGSMGSINFRSFLQFLSVFGRHKRFSDERYVFLFRLYDVDQDGTISLQDLTHVLKLLVGGWCSQEQTQKIAERTMQAAGCTDSPGITFDKFVALLGEGGQLARLFNFRLGEHHGEAGKEVAEGEEEEGGDGEWF